MSRRNFLSYSPSDYYPTRHVAPGRTGHSSDQMQHTHVAREQQQWNQPHYTGYNRFLEHAILCRCANPVGHGDAFSNVSTSESYTGMPSRDLNAIKMSWDEEMHRLLDALEKDYATREEVRSVWSQVYHPDTVRALWQKHRNGEWAMARGITVRGVPHNVIWHGRVNPQNVGVMPLPETPGLVTIGPQGGYRPGPTASAQGTRLQGRPTTLGHTWGVNQINRGGSSSQGRR
ncbi:hypothetical protein EK21DRAFT_79009 [Setomelanomma holmii]|uniref:Uncharacterized protein n=1 Tax=Setomelanomma holmii TaxID=210430 RepID=A0A9P4GYD0_9PLEO|nr:hypothetical protein EK21DRAFT_79009 [Setomelanomma holmii]